MMRIPFFIIFILLAFSCDSEKEAPTISKNDFSQKVCDKMKECDPAGYQALGGDSACAVNFASNSLSGEECEQYNDIKAAQCETEATKLSCVDFLALMSETLSIESCDTMCDLPTDDDTNEPPTISKGDFAKKACDKIKECDPAMYQEMGGDAACAGTFESDAFSDENCAHYDGATAAQCEATATDLSCANFLAMLSGGFPVESCDAMCDLPTDDDAVDLPDNDGETSFSKSEFSLLLCDRIKECDAARYAERGGDAACATNFESDALSDAECQQYDGINAARCIGQITGMPCEMILAALDQPEMLPQTCQLMCGGATDDDSISGDGDELLQPDEDTIPCAK